MPEHADKLLPPVLAAMSALDDAASAHDRLNEQFARAMLEGVRLDEQLRSIDFQDAVRLEAAAHAYADSVATVQRLAFRVKASRDALERAQGGLVRARKEESHARSEMLRIELEIDAASIWDLVGRFEQQVRGRLQEHARIAEEMRFAAAAAGENGAMALEASTLSPALGTSGPELWTALAGGVKQLYDKTGALPQLAEMTAQRIGADNPGGTAGVAALSARGATGVDVRGATGVDVRGATGVDVRGATGVAAPRATGASDLAAAQVVAAADVASLPAPSMLPPPVARAAEVAPAVERVETRPPLRRSASSVEISAALLQGLPLATPTPSPAVLARAVTLPADLARPTAPPRPAPRASTTPPPPPVEHDAPFGFGRPDGARKATPPLGSFPARPMARKEPSAPAALENNRGRLDKMLRNLAGMVSPRRDAARARRSREK